MKTSNIFKVAAAIILCLTLNLELGTWNCFAARFVLNNNAYCVISKGAYLVIDTPSTFGITTLGTGGNIISEADTNRVKWNIGTVATGTYTIPFSFTDGSKIPFSFTVTSAGTGSGNLTASTYYTDVTATPNNRPLPVGVTNLNNGGGTENDIFVADRFWRIDVNSYTTNPTADIVFTYRDEEWNTSGGSRNTITEANLRAQRWNGTAWQSPLGVDDATANTVTAMNLNIFSIWRLSEVQEIITPVIWLPSAFSPGSTHGNNILHVLGKGIKELKLVIYDRWGEKVFEKTDNDITTGWDGTYNGKPMNTAVFAYYLTATLTDGTPVTQKGNVSLIR